MINSRDLKELHPAVRRRAEAFLSIAKSKGYDIIVTSTYRDFDSQQALYDQGRTKAGKKVTNAKPGQSWHNWRCAFDIVPVRAGKPVWGTTGDDLRLWQSIAAIAKGCGLEWAGDWARFKEMAHFQFTAGLSLAELQAGKTIPENA